MAARTSRFLTFASVAWALALAVTTARAQEPAHGGVDLTVMDGSLLTQDWMLGDGFPGLVVPQLVGDGGTLFQNETSALSWNFLTLLILLSGEYDPDDPYAHYDPSDPSTAQSEGKCSFLQPMYCSSIHAFFEIRLPELESATTLGAIRPGGRHAVSDPASARVPGRPATPDASTPWDPTRTVNPQIFREVSIPGTRSPILPDDEDPIAAPGIPNRNDVRAGGNSTFGRRDFVWHQGTRRGCLPPRRGLSDRDAEASAVALERAQRRGRCPPR